ncbi:unnamed protein product [Ambrosiozyma monospora]|uniref:Unnamed protein product n=1 Tax=Ambrosiozyma monospora TaxID=43982 RepID=A0A9W6YXT4_AMBMO|nr:unnamed protein product [Ambrosiozyma monospora]
MIDDSFAYIDDETLSVSLCIRNDSLTSINHKKIRVNYSIPFARTTLIKGIESFYKQEKHQFKNIPITCGFDNYNPKMICINPAQIYDMQNEILEEDYNESITDLFVYISSYRFDDDQ